MTDITQERCQHKRREMKCGEMPFRERERRQDSRWRRWSPLPVVSERGCNRERGVGIRRLLTHFKRVILTEVVGKGRGGTSQVLPAPGGMVLRE